MHGVFSYQVDVRLYDWQMKVGVLNRRDLHC